MLNIKLNKFTNLIKHKSFWHKGSGELTGFAIIMPFIILLIFIIVGATEISIVNQKLTYTAYDCCRAAVVSETMDSAEDRAIEMYEYHLCSVSEATKDHSFIPCELTLVDGTEWEKGSLVKCTVRSYLNPLMPFTSGVREQSIVMMVENGDSNS